VLRERYAIDGEPDPFRTSIPGAETWAEFSVRAGARLRRVANDHPGARVVVVCHGGVIGASFVALGDVPIRQATTLTRETVNTSITEWRRTGTSWHLVRYNDAAHLAPASGR
jgi:broad specificity phosphatase PhoE